MLQRAIKSVSRRQFLKSVGTTALAAGTGSTIIVPGHAQPKNATERQQHIPHIGFLRASPPPSLYIDAFQQGLGELGYVAGQNIIIEYRHAGRESERLANLAVELVQLNVKAIFGAGTDATRALKQATGTIPIVLVSADPLADGFVMNLDRQGGNMTGFSMMARELSVKRVEILKEAFPQVSRMALFWDPFATQPQITLQETQTAAHALGVQIISLEIRHPSELANAFATASREQAEALVFLPSLTFNTHRKQLAELAAATRLPAMYEHGTFAKAGGLMSYGPNIPDLLRRAGVYMGRILNGAKPGDLPVQQPTKFELIINLKTAKQLRLQIPPTVLYQASALIR